MFPLLKTQWQDDSFNCNIKNTRTILFKPTNLYTSPKNNVNSADTQCFLFFLTLLLFKRIFTYYLHVIWFYVIK